jgi:hypothetical protein
MLVNNLEFLSMVYTLDSRLLANSSICVVFLHTFFPSDSSFLLTTNLA